MEMVKLPCRQIELHNMGSTLYLYPMRYTWMFVQGYRVGYCECLVKIHNELYKIGVPSALRQPKVYQAIHELYLLLGYNESVTSIQEFIKISVRNQFSAYFDSSRDYENKIWLYDEAFTYAKRVLQGIRSVMKAHKMFRRTTCQTVNNILNYGINTFNNESLCPTYHNYVNREE